MQDYTKVELIPVRDIHEDADNPNAMDDRTYSHLVESIQGTDGIIEPLITMECDCDIIEKKPHRKIIGGEHRWRAAQEESLNIANVPCIDYLPKEKDDDKFLMTNLNRIHGTLVSAKMARLITQLTDTHSFENIRDRLNLSNKEYIDFIGKEEAAKQGIAEHETDATKEAVEKSKSKEKGSSRKKPSTIGTLMFILQMNKLDKEYLDEAINHYVENNKAELAGNVRSIALGEICKRYLTDNGVAI